MAFKIEQTGGSAAYTEGFYEPVVNETVTTGVDTTQTPNATVASGPTYWTTNFQDPTKFTANRANSKNTWMDPKEGECQFLLLPINWQLVNDEIINGSSYSLKSFGIVNTPTEDTDGSATKTTIVASVEKWVGIDGLKEASDTNKNQYVVESTPTLTCVEEGANVWAVPGYRKITVTITPDATLLSTYKPVVDVDGKYSDYKVLSNGIEFVSTQNHRINIHWTKDMVETFYFVASL